ncbi:Relaxase/Mobilisation nuclease domain-containing protein [Cetobacterium ceti]|uniref:Relaxase/Mobilisation nuclease domain-containing protein n=1 Tax=Cetobacterium ceti TaxID=180163 RepID=A0A1T4R9T1_9FUSO|nr:relaxase/mobilization nuclease domain-containing protein [Cetobacterium ceti]SKA12675.1 Relaxase/Mobilisation nuclease domain-containing protein [Cetobacterium ceti]
MAIIKAINSSSGGTGSSKGLENYLDKEKSLKTGIDCDCDNWSSDFRLTKAIYNKLEGRQYKHFTQSFEHNCGLTQEQVHKEGIKLVESCKQFKGFQAVIITHNDKKHLHNHIVINSVSLETGKKFQMSNSQLQTLKKNMTESLKKDYNLEPTKAKENIVKTQRTKTYQVLKKAKEGNYNSFVLDLGRDITDSLNQSTTKEELKEKLSEKNIEMDISTTHNTIMFITKDKKKISSKKLNSIFGVNFDKNSLEETLKINSLESDEGLKELKQETNLDRKIGIDKLREQEIKNSKKCEKLKLTQEERDQIEKDRINPNYKYIPKEKFNGRSRGR